MTPELIKALGQIVAEGMEALTSAEKELPEWVAPEEHSTVIEIEGIEWSISVRKGEQP